MEAEHQRRRLCGVVALRYIERELALDTGDHDGMIVAIRVLEGDRVREGDDEWYREQRNDGRQEHLRLSALGFHRWRFHARASGDAEGRTRGTMRIATS